jgi:hypothetical protein
MNIGTKRGRTAPSKLALQEARDVIARETSGYRPGGLRVNTDRLSEDEQERLVALVNEAGSGRAWWWDKLKKKDRTALEGLIEKGADAPRIFEETRALEEIRALAAEAHVAAVRRPFRPREESGILHELGRQFADGFLTADMLGPLLVVFLSLERGEAFAPQARVERDPDGEQVLVVSRAYGLVSERRDWRGSLAAWPQALTHAERNAWLIVDRSAGNSWEIRLGARAKRAMRGQPPRKKRVAA